MVRSVIAGFFLIILIILTVPVVGVAELLGLFDRKIQYRMARVIGSVYGASLFIVAGSRLHITGRENIPKGDSAVLLVGNHRSFLDIPLVVRYAGIPVGFISKASLKKAPLLNVMMRQMGCLYLNREDVRQAFEIIQQGIKKLKDGDSLAIFPEGTRSKTEDITEFKQGSLKLAEKAGVPVVPFALKGTDKIFHPDSLRMRRTDIWLSFGEPIQLSDLSKEDQKKSAAYVQSIVQGMYDKMQ